MRFRSILFALVFALIPMALSAETMMECFRRCPPGNNSCSRCCSDHARPTSDCRRGCFTARCEEVAKCGPHPRCTPCEVTECEGAAYATCGARRETCLAKCDEIDIGNQCRGGASKTTKTQKLAKRF